MNFVNFHGNKRFSIQYQEFEAIEFTNERILNEAFLFWGDFYSMRIFSYVPMF